MKYSFKNYEIEELREPRKQQFLTFINSTNTGYKFTVTEEIRNYIESIQLNYCSEISPVKDYIYSNNIYFVNSKGEPSIPLKSGTVQITLSTPRLIKTIDSYYPKFEINTVCIL